MRSYHKTLTLRGLLDAVKLLFARAQGYHTYKQYENSCLRAANRATSGPNMPSSEEVEKIMSRALKGVKFSSLRGMVRKIPENLQFLVDGDAKKNCETLWNITLNDSTALHLVFNTQNQVRKQGNAAAHPINFLHNSQELLISAACDERGAETVSFCTYQLTTCCQGYNAATRWWR